MNTQIIQELASKDMMPAKDVVQDFYETQEIEPSPNDRWKEVPEHLLADLDVPGYPDICPLKAWHVFTDTGIWMIYTWYEEPFGTDDDVWIYADIKGKRLKSERMAYNFQDAMQKILDMGK